MQQQLEQFDAQVYQHPEFSYRNNLTGYLLGHAGLDQFHRTDAFQWLNGQLAEHVSAYLSSLLGPDHGLVAHIQKAWPVVCARNGGTVDIHSHRNSQLSAVFHVLTDPANESGELEFEAPDDYFSHVMAMLRSNGIDPAGKRAVVIGRSILVGQPMALMLQAANATVTIAHSRTADLAAHTREADILVVAAGRPEFIGAEHVRPGAAVVDVGIHRKPEGGLCGDVRAAEVESIAAALSPVPGGVGPMTVTMLLVNTVLAWCRRHNIDHDLDDLVP